MTTSEAEIRVSRALRAMAVRALLVMALLLGWIVVFQYAKPSSESGANTWEMVSFAPVTATALAGFILLFIPGRRRLNGMMLVLGSVLAVTGYLILWFLPVLLWPSMYA